MGIDHFCRQGLLQHGQHAALGIFGLGAGALIEEALKSNVLPPGESVGPGLGQQGPQPIGEAVLGRSGHHVGWRALHHGHLGAPFSHGGDEGHGRGATPDDSDPLTRIVQIFRPKLRMDALASKGI